MNQNKQMIMNYYQNEILDYDKDFYNQYGIYVKPHGYSISSRKIESYIQIAEIQKYLQCNPVKAIDLFFNIELLDGKHFLYKEVGFVQMYLLYVLVDMVRVRSLTLK